MLEISTFVPLLFIDHVWTERLLQAGPCSGCGDGRGTLPGQVSTSCAVMLCPEDYARGAERYSVWGGRNFTRYSGTFTEEMSLEF